MVMDWILRRHNLPPAALQGGEVNVAVFGMGDAMGAGGANHDADHAVRMVTQGIERTINILSTAVRT